MTHWTFTGHRELLKPSIHINSLKTLRKELVNQGVSILNIGMQRGYDLIAGKLSKSLGIKIHTYTPNNFHRSRLSPNDQLIYDELVEYAEENYIVNTYTSVKECIWVKDYIDRNNRMIESSDKVVAVHDGRTTGGTYYTLNKSSKGIVIYDMFTTNYRQ